MIVAFALETDKNSAIKEALWTVAIIMITAQIMSRMRCKCKGQRSYNVPSLRHFTILNHRRPRLISMSYHLRVSPGHCAPFIEITAFLCGVYG